MEKVTRSFKNLYHGIAIPNQIHSAIIALSDESEQLASHSPMRMNDACFRTRQAWQLTLQTKDISETDGNVQC